MGTQHYLCHQQLLISIIVFLLQYVDFLLFTDLHRNPMSWTAQILFPLSTEENDRQRGVR